MKLKGCLISDMEKIQEEYYILFCDEVEKVNKAIKEKEYIKHKKLVQAYSNCYEKMNKVLKFVNAL